MTYQPKSVGKIAVHILFQITKHLERMLVSIDGLHMINLLQILVWSIRSYSVSLKLFGPRKAEL